MHRQEFQFKDKVVYVLSPEAWGDMRFSKHHYALELALLGSRVYFLEPPDLSKAGIDLRRSEENGNLSIVSYKPVFRAKRFLPSWIYRMLLRLQISRLIHAIGVKPDVVFCFDPFRFSNLNWFGASVKIFFMADLFSTDEFPEEATTADICLGLSTSRLQVLQKGPKPAYFINHGLSSFYTEWAKNELTKSRSIQVDGKRKLVAGYIGNLTMAALDRQTMRSVILHHPEMDFIFWGQYEMKGQLVAYESQDVSEFVDFLKSQPNVKLRGAVHPERLSKEIPGVDMFWVCWKLGVYDIWDGSNPHKILEYLSTGKPVISHYVDAYRDKGLLDMMNDPSNQSYSEKFDAVVERVRSGEEPDLIEKRLRFALDNSYQNQLARIENFVRLQENN